MLTNKNNKFGFTLIELAITFTVVSMIIGTVLVGLSKSDRTEKYVNTKKKLEKIAAALRVYANTPGYDKLPCPAPAGLQFSDPAFGIANCATSGLPITKIESTDAGNVATNIYGGMVPFATLGLPYDYAFDEWGRRISYIVDGDATGAGAASNASLKDSLNIKIKTTTEDVVRVDSTTSNAQGAAYVLISHGQNGYLTLNARVGTAANRILPTAGSVAASIAGVTNNEKENCPTSSIVEPPLPDTTGVSVCDWDAAFIQSVPIQNPEGNYFDDIVIYKLADELK